MAIGEVFLGAFLMLLFEKLASGDLLNFARREQIHTLLIRWQRMLEQIEAVLADAEEKQIEEIGIQTWLEDLEDLAYDLDDVVDDIATEALREKLMDQGSHASTSKVFALIPSCYTSINPRTLRYGFKMKSKMAEITTRLQDLFERGKGLGIHEKVAARASDKAWKRPPTTSLIQEPCIFGRDEDKKAIIELLLSDQSSNNKVGVVPIIGMGGVGKTTLAQMVYNEEIVERHFDLKAWVCVSEEFDIMRVSKAILESVTFQPCDFKSLDQVQGQLKKALAQQKFLIVLDDVWNEKHGDWISLKSPFNDGARGSKVLVTTRNTDIALMMGTVKYHSLEKLSDADCWSLFSQHVFENIRVDASQNLVSIGRKIVAKCGGLPLAARTLGGLLRSKSGDDEWEDVLNSKIWELSDKKSDILPALRVSYYHLPSHLKKCFAYSSILPKDYEFEEEELVLLWMAEGFIQKPKGEKQMEDLGRGYFRELLARSFFQPSSSSGSSLFVMHDLINDLAQFVSRNICFRLEDKVKDNDWLKKTSKARHASYIRGNFDGIQKFEAFREAKKLRTLFSCGSIDQDNSYLTSNVPLNLLRNLRYLRVLSLRSYQIGELWSKVGDLKHVRYLDLSNARIQRLPESLSTLYNLETLILRGCINLKKLPRDMGNLINMRHLDVSGAISLQEMPSKMGKLTNLQTLSNYIISKGNGSMIKELGNLIYLRGSLCISGLENVLDVAGASRSNLNDKHRLDVLSMEWNENMEDSQIERVRLDVLDVLQPHKNIKKLTIISYPGLRFPTWVGDQLFTNIVCLRLENCEKCSFLPPLGQLPSLAKLHIQGMKAVENVGLEFYGLGCSKPFPSLEILRFVDMTEWKDWSPFGFDEAAQAFARLLELSIVSCPKLLGILPSNIPCLKKLKIEGCPHLVVDWVPSPTMLHGTRNTLQFDSLTSLSLKDVSIPVFLHRPDVADDVVPENAARGHLSLLTSMSVRNILDVTCFPSWFFQGMTGLQELEINNCKFFTTLWQNEVRLQHYLPALLRLVIKSCPQLISLFEEDNEGQLQQPNIMSLEHLEIKHCNKLEKLPRGLPTLLRMLCIHHCDNLQALPELMILNNLEKLMVLGCPSLKRLLCPGAGLPPSLKELMISNCNKLESLLAEEGMAINCPSLESIKICNCDNLKSLPDVMQNNGLRNLHWLYIIACGSLESLPEGWFPTTNLTELSIAACNKLEAIPQSAYNSNSSSSFTSLEWLEVGTSPAAAGIASYVLKEGSSLTNLTYLEIANNDNDKPLSEWGLHRLVSLRQLVLNDYNWVSFTENGLLWPTSLIELRIKKFRNLEKLCSKGFQTLTSLEEIRIGECPKLTSIAGIGLLPSLSSLVIVECPDLALFPDQGLPLSLLELYIHGCPLLKERCEKEKGQYWPFIAHIPCVRIDGRFIFDPKP